MAGVPFANGRYQDIAATTSHADLRVFGQKDLQAGSATSGSTIARTPGARSWMGAWSRQLAAQ